MYCRIYASVNWVSIGSRNGCSVPSHYLNQCCLIVNWTLQWNSNQNTKLFIHENAFENTIWEMAAMLSREDELTHWGQVTHICVSRLTIIGSDNGLSPDRRQAIIWTNAGLLLIGPLGTNFSEILIEILTFSFKKMRLKVSSAKRRTFCLNVLMHCLGQIPRTLENILAVSSHNQWWNAEEI